MSHTESGERAPDRHTSCAKSKASIARPAALPASAHHHSLRRCGVGLLVSLLVALTGALPLALGGCGDDQAPVTLGPTLSLTSSTSGITTTPTTSEAKVPAKVTVPEVVHHYLDEAEDLLSPLGLTCEVVHEEWQTAGSSDDYWIYEQDPAPGTEVAPGSSVEVSIWRFGSVVPDVVGETKAAAIDLLEDWYGLTVNVVYTPTVLPAEVGIVLSQDPAAGTPLLYFDGPVTIEVGKIAFKPKTATTVTIPPLVPIIPKP